MCIVKQRTHTAAKYFYEKSEIFFRFSNKLKTTAQQQLCWKINSGNKRKKIGKKGINATWLRKIC